MRRYVPPIAAVLALFAACTHAPPATAPVPGAPKFPDFIFPAPAQDAGTPGLIDLHRSAWQFLQAGDVRDADRTFNAITKETPSFYPAEAGLGYVALARRDAQSALAHFDRALARNSAYAPALAGKGDALLSLGRTDAALGAFEAAIAADPSLTDLKNRAEVLRFRTVQQQISGARRFADGNQLEDAKKAYQAAIAASPQSAFLYRELAAVERRASDLEAALADAQKAASLDPNDARALTLVGEIHEARREWTKAADAYQAAAAVETTDALSARADAMRERAAFDAMPEEYKTIAGAPAITRAQLATLVGVRLDDVIRRARGRNAVVVTDVRGNWAYTWIQAVARAGAMEVYPNHTFQPNATVRRVDLAQTVSRVLALLAPDHPRAAAKWREGRPRFPDVAPGHLSYPAAAAAVSAGVLTTGDAGAFELARPVTGAEAMAAVDKLAQIAKNPAR
jgi:tetratricopeptide (TPR) repeat protein